MRVGMEDGLYINPAGSPAKSNAQQVEKIKLFWKRWILKLQTAMRRGQMLHLKGKEYVNF